MSGVLAGKVAVVTGASGGIGRRSRSPWPPREQTSGCWRAGGRPLRRRPACRAHRPAYGDRNRRRHRRGAGRPGDRDGGRRARRPHRGHQQRRRCAVPRAPRRDAHLPAGRRPSTSTSKHRSSAPGRRCRAWSAQAGEPSSTSDRSSVTPPSTGWRTTAPPRRGSRCSTARWRASGAPSACGATWSSRG